MKTRRWTRRVLAFAMAFVTAWSLVPRTGASAAGPAVKNDNGGVTVGVEEDDRFVAVEVESAFRAAAGGASVELAVSGVAVPESLVGEAGAAEAAAAYRGDGFAVVVGAGRYADGQVPAAELALEVCPDDGDEYRAVMEEAAEKYDKVYDVTGLKYRFRFDGEDLDMSGCTVGVKAEYESETVEAVLYEVLESVEDEDELDGFSMNVSAYAVVDDGDVSLMDSSEVSAVAMFSGNGNSGTVNYTATASGEDDETGGFTPEGSDGNAWIVVNKFGTWLVMGSGANPSYTVEYWSCVPVLKLDTDTAGGNQSNKLSVIDTSAKGRGGNGNITTSRETGLEIKNTTDLPVVSLVLDDNGKVHTEERFRRIYGDVVYEYQNSPRAVYADKVSGGVGSNTNYDLSEVWVWNGGPEGPSDEATGDVEFDRAELAKSWTMYARRDMFQNGNDESAEAAILDSLHKVTNLDQLRFVNDESNIPSGWSAEAAAESMDSIWYVVLGKDSLIRFVYTPKTGLEKTLHADMYDYDVSDGNRMMYSFEEDRLCGVNSVFSGMRTGTNTVVPGTLETGDRTPLMMGGWNNGTTAIYANKRWGSDGGSDSGYFINRRNAETINGQRMDLALAGCAFGMVDHLDGETGSIRYSDGIWAPSLFGESDDVPGKSKYDSDLIFGQDGDTYTLSTVKVGRAGEPPQTAVTGVDKFGHPGIYDGVQHTTCIWTTNFWPLDKFKSELDGLTGGPETEGMIYTGQDGANAHEIAKSDDGISHNNLFGMVSKVDFEVTSDYVGPLEYLFFGDDDLWVFLSPVDADGNVGDGRLICDVGGIHSSVGEYVDLWDHIALNGDGTAQAMKYRLTFFYMERGYSGSTCYIQFTLPSVSHAESDVELPQDKTTFTLTKTVGRLEETDGEYVVSEATADTVDDPDGGFKFVVGFLTKDGQPLGLVQDGLKYIQEEGAATYPWGKTTADGQYVPCGVLGWISFRPDDAGDAISDAYARNYAGLTVQLKRGESVTVSGLPKNQGVKVVVFEDQYSGYLPSVAVGDIDGAPGQVEVTRDSNAFTGVLQDDMAVTFVNQPVSFEMPHTGGTGTVPYVITGTVLVCAACVALAYGRKRRRA